jgi:hypothetical protein
MNTDNTVKPAWIALLFLSAFTLAGCGSSGVPDQNAQLLAQERDKLQAENQAIDQVRAENQEAQKLKKENEELPKLRSQYQEASRLRKENEQLRQQLAKLSHSNAVPATADVHGAAAGQTPGQPDKPKELAQDEGTLNEGDDIYIEPKYLKQLLPDFDWEKLGRKEPLAIRSLLEKDGIPLTNVTQLKEYGLTNYAVRRAPAKAPPAPQPAP